MGSYVFLNALNRQPHRTVEGDVIIEGVQETGEDVTVKVDGRVWDCEVVPFVVNDIETYAERAVDDVQDFRNAIVHGFIDPFGRKRSSIWET